jgi:hypothetical protein
MARRIDRETANPRLDGNIAEFLEMRRIVHLEHRESSPQFAV